MKFYAIIFSRKEKMLLKFDSDKDAVINPEDITSKVENMPETAISFFETKILNEFLDLYPSSLIGEIKTSCKNYPVFKTRYKNKTYAVMQAAVGAACCVGNFENLIAMGVKNILMFGSCGTLAGHAPTSIIIPTAALRDEGTSYHYLPASDQVELDPKYVNRIKAFCTSKKIPFQTGKTWTTDAFFRETRKKVSARLKQGCISVEMECAAMAALAKFRGVNFSEFFYVSDSLSLDDYDVGILKKKADLCGEEKLLPLAFELASQLFE